MTQFLYFLADVQSVSAESIAAAGIEYAFDSPLRIAQAELVSGPDGSPGLIFCQPPPGPPLSICYEPAAQTWQQIPNSAAWIGMDREAPPGPSDLARAEFIDGHFVTLADDHQWLIPLVRQMPQGTCALPAGMALGPNGEWITKPLPRYMALCRHADRAWQALRVAVELDKPATRNEITLAEATEIATEALALNYRMGSAEVSALGLLTTQNVVMVMQALIDMPTLMEVAAARAASMSKKKSVCTLDGCNTSGGAPGS